MNQLPHRSTLYVLFCLILGAFLIFDLSYSFLGYYNTSLRGDLVPICFPVPSYAPILTDPLGIGMLLSGEPHVSPNRFLVYWGPICTLIMSLYGSNIFANRS